MADAAKNVNIWKDARVWIADSETAKVGTNGEFGDDWVSVGVLAEGSSIGQEPETDRVEIKAFGGSLITTDQKFSKDVRTFTALEDNDTTFSLIWPNAYKSANGSFILRKPTDALKIVAFETTNQRGEKVVDVTRQKANVYPSSMEKSDDGASTVEFTVEVRADDKDTLYERHTFDGSAVPADVDFIRFEVDASQPDPVGTVNESDTGETV
ncbi:hypothetical protein [Corynebacterium heidelbergense]|uniref:Phage tail protein n=1 Tax=Corynebacterium heidelbergense TaxID=2055947 RepID=A0A364VE52_9CORY|nr:hypothetical protein [Corynebacterium heidelbergense]RAV34923.1 hypothetical protein CWC39_00875 [Corynebacterium heidelbergense]WCZ36062.1 hypothetical protein CHEID_02480 [Corynebacterium heidelbergense]